MSSPAHDLDHHPIPSRLRFGDEADVDKYLLKLEQFERGEIASDVWRQQCRLNGVYDQRQEKVSMIRVKIPGGILTPALLDALAFTADKWGRGKGHVTTRQNVQFHFVPDEEVPELLRYLANAGLTTREACGHSVRNFTSCVRSGVSADEPFDVTPYMEALAAYFLRKPFSVGMPRKFKPSIGGCCGTDCSQAFINDLGFLARVRDGQPGFRVLVGGGLSTLRRSALTAEEFVPAAELLEAAEAVVHVFHRIGNRSNLAKARIKWAIDKIGPEAFIREYQLERDKIRAEGGRPFELPAQPPVPVLRPGLPQLAAAQPGFEAWAADSAHAQKQAGFSLVQLRIVLGDLTAQQLRDLGRLATEYGEGEVRLTNDQDVALRFIPTWKLPLLHADLVTAGLARPGAGTILDVTSCPGASSCGMSVTQSRGLARLLGDTLEARPDIVARARTLSIKISGCPNSCGQHHVAGLGFQGGMRKVGGKAVAQYIVYVGGGIGPDGARFARMVTKIPVRRLPIALDRLTALYAASKLEGETADAYFARVELDTVRATLVGLDVLTPEDATADDFLDLDEHGANVDLHIQRGNADVHMC